AILAMSLSGHAFGARELGPAAVGVDSLHLVAAAVWLGGLVHFAVLLTGALAAAARERAEVLRTLVPRGSKVALVSVAMLVVTGAFSAWEQVGGLDTLTVTAYGQSLLLKLALVAVLVALGAINLLVMRPRLSRARQSPGGLRAARTFRVLVLSEVM